MIASLIWSRGRSPSGGGGREDIHKAFKTDRRVALTARLSWPLPTEKADCIFLGSHRVAHGGTIVRYLWSQSTGHRMCEYPSLDESRSTNKRAHPRFKFRKGNVARMEPQRICKGREAPLKSGAQNGLFHISRRHPPLSNEFAQIALARR